ncbi:hypothetical protein HW115_17020 [Verrucomicrobiaceae bacterium N1E253]|uniref:Uncharacterized protein n=1 Tax=Oceaniferula marina TaxID=2748318 RepID=A0A851GQD5_9BACT|nr:hypothetical protein [Oceaniferula marina]NWK57325.1 hypothetical protein [Oceaniferula marina]
MPKNTDPSASEREKNKFHKLLQETLDSKEFASEEELNAYLEEHFTGRQISEILDEQEPDNSPRGKAEAKLDLIDPYNAEASNRRHAIAATKLDPTCIEAWVSLADTYQSEIKAEAAYRKAIELGELEFESFIKESLSISDKNDPEEKSWLWGHHAARPFLMALQGLADIYESQDFYDEAIDMYEHILRLNGNDNQGVRYILLPMYFIHETEEKIESLLSSYPNECSPQWLFSKALYTFQKTYTEQTEGGSWQFEEPEDLENVNDMILLPQLPKAFHEANALLKQAMESNGMVPLFLCDMRCSYFSSADSCQVGGADEAFMVAQTTGILWALDPLANLWLQESCFGPLHRELLAKDLQEHYHHVAELDKMLDQVEIAKIANQELASSTTTTDQIRKIVLSTIAPDDDKIMSIF